MAGDKTRTPWSNAEKTALLLEIIRETKATPNWNKLRLPQGRTADQAEQIFNTMTSVSPSGESAPEWEESLESNPITKKRHHGEFGDAAQGGSSIPTGEGSSTMETPLTKRKRGRPTKEESAARRAALERGEDVLRPKYVPKPASPVVLNPDGTQQKRKRGRPSKAEQAARRAHAQDEASRVRSGVALNVDYAGDEDGEGDEEKFD